jgi:hypothetical protein
MVVVGVPLHCPKGFAAAAAAVATESGPHKGFRKLFLDR